VRPRAEVEAQPGIRDRVRRALYRVALPVYQAYQLIARPRTRSVACLITHGEEVLLVRHTYRDRERWTLPGGLRRNDETAEDAAGREMEEELGRRLTAWRAVHTGRRRSRAGLHITTYLRAELDSRRIDPDAGELARTAWFPVAQLPEAITGDAVRMIRRAGLDRGSDLA
jgi:ADP-ribose pyrophosphatase YjhB (NUDIX family)